MAITKLTSPCGVQVYQDSFAMQGFAPSTPPKPTADLPQSVFQGPRAEILQRMLDRIEMQGGFQGPGLQTKNILFINDTFIPTKNKERRTEPAGKKMQWDFGKPLRHYVDLHPARVPGEVFEPEPESQVGLENNFSCHGQFLLESRFLDILYRESNYAFIRKMFPEFEQSVRIYEIYRIRDDAYAGSFNVDKSEWRESREKINRLTGNYDQSESLINDYLCEVAGVDNEELERMIGSLKEKRLWPRDCPIGLFFDFDNRRRFSRAALRR